METIDPTRLIEKLNGGQRKWTDLNDEKKRALYDHYLTRLATHPRSLSQQGFRQQAPGWFPITTSLTATRLFGCGWNDLIARYGMRPPGNARHCDCGARATHHVDIRIGNPQLHFKTVKMPLCDACMAEHLELEGIPA